LFSLIQNWLFVTRGLPAWKEYLHQLWTLILFYLIWFQLDFNLIIILFQFDLIWI
jgi:hypothetical protein